jgi:hypothetical protein
MKIKIEIVRDIDMIEKVFEGKSIQKKLYLMKSNSCLNLCEWKLKKYITKKDKHSIYAQDEGSEEYIKKQYKDLDNFFLMTQKDLNEYPEFKKVISDRRFISKFKFAIKRIEKKCKEKISDSKNSLFKKVLGGDNIISFFSKMGLNVKYEIEDD